MIFAFADFCYSTVDGMGWGFALASCGEPGFGVLQPLAMCSLQLMREIALRERDRRRGKGHPSSAMRIRRCIRDPPCCKQCLCPTSGAALLSKCNDRCSSVLSDACCRWLSVGDLLTVATT